MTIRETGVPIATAALATFCAYGIGAAHAYFLVARQDYRDARAKVPPARRKFWSALGQLIKAGTVAAVAATLFAFWFTRLQAR